MILGDTNFQTTSGFAWRVSCLKNDITALVAAEDRSVLGAEKCKTNHWEND